MKSPRIQLSVKKLMVLVALIALGMPPCYLIYQVVRAMFFLSTVYSKEYSEERYFQIQEGTIAAEVMTLLGPPLDKYEYPGWGDGVVVWMYSEEGPWANNYKRRDVFMQHGKVESLVYGDWYD